MDVVSPTMADATRMLGNAANSAHAAKCGTCACKCACRYNNGAKKSPW